MTTSGWSIRASTFMIAGHLRRKDPSDAATATGCPDVSIPSPKNDIDQYIDLDAVVDETLATMFKAIGNAEKSGRAMAAGCQSAEAWEKELEATPLRDVDTENLLRNMCIKEDAVAKEVEEYFKRESPLRTSIPSSSLDTRRRNLRRRDSCPEDVSLKSAPACAPAKARRQLYCEPSVDEPKRPAEEPKPTKPTGVDAGPARRSLEAVEPPFQTAVDKVSCEELSRKKSLIFNVVDESNGPPSIGQTRIPRALPAGLDVATKGQRAHGHRRSGSMWRVVVRDGSAGSSASLG